MNKNKNRTIASLIFNCANLALVVYAIVWCISKIGFVDKALSTINVFYYFTFQSNILAAVASLVLIPRCIKKIAGKAVSQSNIPIVLKLAATGATLIVLLVVVALLGPLYGYGPMYGEFNLYLHAVCPLLTVLSFIFLDGDGELARKKIVFGCLPVFLYSILYLTMVIIVEKWPDFYGFNRGGFWYLSFIGMNCINPLVVNLMRRLHNRFSA